VAALLLRIFASIRAGLGVTNDARVLAMEQNILQRLICNIGSVDNVFQIRLGEAYKKISKRRILHVEVDLPLSLMRTSEQ